MTAIQSNRVPLQLRSGYFWFYAAIGALSPFISLYYRDLGMSGLQVGVLMALPALWTALAGTVWGAVADSLAIHRLLLRIMPIVAALMALFVAIPTTFVALFVLVAILSFVVVPIPPLLDSYAVNMAEQSGLSYGSVRVWGSIGFTVMVLILGRLLGGEVTVLFLFVYAVCLFMTWASVFGLPRLAERRPRPLLDGLHAVRRSKSFILLLIVSYLLSSGFSIIVNFLGIHMRAMGGSTEVIGIAFAVAAVSELPILVFSGWLMTRLGARGLVLLALAMYTVRFLILGFASMPWQVALAQMLHGVSFGAFLIASVSLGHRLVGSENAATAQAALGTVSFGFGSITGALVAGALLDALGTHAIFRGVTVLMLVTIALFVVGSRYIRSGSNDPAVV